MLGDHLEHASVETAFSLCSAASPGPESGYMLQGLFGKVAAEKWLCLPSLLKPHIQQECKDTLSLYFLQAPFFPPQYLLILIIKPP